MSKTPGYYGIKVSKERVVDFCRRRHIRKLAFFGSVLRENFGPESDVDVLVEFEPGHIPGLAFFSMENELSEILGRKVDLNTPQFLSRYFRQRVLAEAQVQYAASRNTTSFRHMLDHASEAVGMMQAKRYGVRPI